jgi:hypothetical protein
MKLITSLVWATIPFAATVFEAHAFGNLAQGIKDAAAGAAKKVNDAAKKASSAATGVADAARKASSAIQQASGDAAGAAKKVNDAAKKASSAVTGAAQRTGSVAQAGSTAPAALPPRNQQQTFQQMRQAGCIVQYGGLWFCRTPTGWRQCKEGSNGECVYEQYPYYEKMGNFWFFNTGQGEPMLVQYDERLMKWTRI